jgi:hypothetical protein
MPSIDGVIMLLARRISASTQYSLPDEGDPAPLHDGLLPSSPPVPLPITGLPPAFLHLPAPNPLAAAPSASSGGMRIDVHDDDEGNGDEDDDVPTPVASSTRLHPHPYTLRRHAPMGVLSVPPTLRAGVDQRQHVFFPSSTLQRIPSGSPTGPPLRKTARLQLLLLLKLSELSRAAFAALAAALLLASSANALRSHPNQASLTTAALRMAACVPLAWAALLRAASGRVETRFLLPHARSAGEARWGVRAANAAVLVAAALFAAGSAADLAGARARSEGGSASPSSSSSPPVVAAPALYLCAGVLVLLASSLELWGAVLLCARAPSQSSLLRDLLPPAPPPRRGVRPGGVEGVEEEDEEGAAADLHDELNSGGDQAASARAVVAVLAASTTTTASALLTAGASFLLAAAASSSSTSSAPALHVGGHALFLASFTSLAAASVARLVSAASHIPVPPHAGEAVLAAGEATVGAALGDGRAGL